MRILRLAIRNIASIQEADIDFENDLRSFGEEQPASLFLISGDTGSGKTVILDCIAMALYGTTPRVKGVAGKRNNSFSIREGEEISLNDIAQYTRMGITWKDECYSRLTFIGNDGIEYVSTFSLGVTNRGNLRDASWKLEIGGKEIIQGSKKEEIKTRIREAIGLSYHQFARMAMLAQGEFADFLTGGKEEREKILEQLTNTGHFSRYGEAIVRIFKRAKQEKEAAAALIQSEGRHILMDEEETHLRQQALELKKEAEILSREKSHNDMLITDWEGFHTHLKERRSIRKELLIQKRITTSEDFIRTLADLKKWDESNIERNLLLRKRELSSSLEKALISLLNLSSSFENLSVNLEGRKALLSEARMKEKELSDWIEEKGKEKSLYADLPAVEEKVASLRSLESERIAATKQMEEARLSLPKLHLNKEEIMETTTQLEKKCEELKKEREEKISLRDSLHPEEIAKTLQELAKTHAFIENYLKDFDSFQKADSELEEMTKERDFLKKEVESLAKKKEEAENEREEKKKRYEEADSRFTTMHLSVSENFSRLRARLAHNHSQSCPLCGADTDWAALSFEEDSFADILSPLEKERNEALQAMNLAEKKAKETLAALNLKEGELKSRNKALDRAKQKLEAERKTITVALISQSIIDSAEMLSESQETIRGNITDRLNTTLSEINRVKELHQKAESLQKEINELTTKRLAPIEKELTDGKNLLSKAETEIKLTEQNIAQLTTSINNLKEKYRLAESHLDGILKEKYPDWKESNFSFLPLLRDEAKEYAGKNEELARLSAVNKREEEILAHVADIRDRILAMYEEAEKRLMLKRAEPDNNVSPKKATDKANLSKEWSELLARVSAALNNALDLNSQLSGIINSLNEYYVESDTDEKALSRLIDMEISIPEMRLHIDETLRKIQSLSDAVGYHSDKARATFRSLTQEGVLNRHDLPKEEILLIRNEEIEKKLHEILQTSGSISDRLERNESNKKNLAAIQKDFEKKSERFIQWDALNRHFGGNRFRTLVQSYILRPLLRNANIYLSRITDRFTLTCSDDNEQLSILVLDRYNKNKVRSATVLSGGERFMISLALSLALSAMNKSDMNVDILFIDEGFGTLDAGSLNAVIDTLRRLPEIAGQNGRRVGVISHREELADRIDVKIRVKKCGEGRSRIYIE